jgi:hypothetical protein
MAGTGTWLLHGIDIGLPLEVDYGISADIGSLRINGAKTTANANSVEPTSFKVQFMKEFSSETEQKDFRLQMEQLQFGIKFMPYHLETNQYAEELNDTLVNLKSVDMPRQAGIVNWIKYEAEFVLLGHKSEFIGYTQYRPIDVKGTWTSWDSWKHVDVSYPVGAMFHSDSPTGTLNGEFGGMDYRVNPSKNAITYQECLGKERVGIVVKQGDVQLFSPHYNVGAGLEISNGYFKLIWDSEGHLTYHRWQGNSWVNTNKIPPNFMFACFDYDSGGNVINHRGKYSRDAIYTKLQLKRVSTEYVEIEQEFQFNTGEVCAIQFFMNRGKNSIQLRARSLNTYIDWFTAYHYLKRELVTEYFVDGTQDVVTDTTNFTDVALANYPELYLVFDSASAGGGYVGYVNPDKNIVHGTIKTNASSGYVEINTRHSYNEAPKVWSEPIMFFQGTTSPSAKRSQAGYLVKADSQVVHRSHVY